MDESKKIEIATFKFGVISDFVTGARLMYGEKERMLNEKVHRIYQIPNSNRTQLSRPTIEKWILDYKKGGYRIEGLYPRDRSDKGKVRSLPIEIKLAIKELKKESPELKIPAIIKMLKHKKLISVSEQINLSTVYRYLKHEELKTVNTEAKDKRIFEASQPNEIWQSDVMHGPQVLVDGKNKKAYLIAIIDDHSRFIVHAEFYLAETRENFLDALRQAVLARGLPSKLYIDNGACFKALHLEQVAAQLGIAITHSRPYTPQGRGKIERWFKYVQDNFLGCYQKRESSDKLELLQTHFDDWVYEYNHNREHGTTKTIPYERYKAGLECIRPAPAHLLDYFRQSVFRRVKKDRTVQLQGHLFEAPVQLIDKQVELRFHAENLSDVEIYFDSKSFGKVVVVSPHVNAKIGREWVPLKPKPTEVLITPAMTPTGQLFTEDHYE